MSSIMSSIKFKHNEHSIEQLVSRYNHGKIKIPKHQRKANVWTDEKRKSFVDTCKKNMPSPSILIYTDEMDQEWFEDGLQRLTTLKDFMGDKFMDLDSRWYSKWTEMEQYRFGEYRIATVEYSGATETERVEIFDRFQNGSPLKTGERLHALSYAPLVKFTKEMFMTYTNSDGCETNGKYLQRAQDVWGVIKCDNTDKRYDELLKLVALINGIVHGWISCNSTTTSFGITKSYIELRKTLMTPITNEMIDNAEQVIKQLLNIYEKADEMYPLQHKKYLSVQKNIGNFTGAIVYSLKTYPNEWDRLHDGWVGFIISCRKDNSLLETKIKKNVAQCRNWTEGRWKNTYMCVFNITNTRVLVSSTSIDHDSEDSYEDD